MNCQFGILPPRLSKTLSTSNYMFGFRSHVIVLAIAMALFAGCSTARPSPIKQAGVVTVSLRDELGGTLPGVCVTLAQRGGGSVCRVTDDKGRAEFSGLAASTGMWNVSVKLLGMADLSVDFWGPDHESVVLPLVVKLGALGGDT